MVIFIIDYSDDYFLKLTVCKASAICQIINISAKNNYFNFFHHFSQAKYQIFYHCS